MASSTHAASPVLLALDEGTTSARAMVWSANGAILGAAQREFAQHFPHDGWVEHDADEIWETQRAAARAALRAAGVKPARVAAVGVANQRETIVVWDRRTGRPVHRAIVWQDRRTTEACAALQRSGLEPDISRRTGLRLDPYFSATKLAWILDNVPGARRRAEQGHLLAGTMDTWLAWKLTSGAAHVTDPSNASRTLLFNLRSCAWDPVLLRRFRIPASMLPCVVPTSGVCGTVARGVLGAGVPLAALVGDQQGALFGQQCVRPGMAKCTYGTGCFLLLNTGARIPRSRSRLLSTVAWKIGGAPTQYALEGSVFVGGAAVQWLRDGLHLIQRSDQVGPLALSVPDSGGVMVVPAFTGLGCPYWDPHARGAVLGITRATTGAHLARATLEGISHQVADVIHAMEHDTRSHVRTLHVDGGAAASDALMQIQADLLGARVERPRTLESTAWGAAALAGIAVGVVRMGARVRQTDRVFAPRMSPARRSAARALWQRGVERAAGWRQESTVGKRGSRA